MKKLFVSLMAVAALVSCSKENEDVILTSSKKSVAITISNEVPQTKAIPEPEQTPVAGGGAATIAKQENGRAVAETDELVVLFANNAGKVVEAYSFEEAEKVETTEDNEGVWEYRYHNVHESVTQVAVVRHAEPEGGYVGTALSTYAAAAAVEDRNVALNDLELYGSAKLNDSGTTCKAANIEAGGHVTEYEYKLYTAEVEVVPTLARVEIVGISCLDLGETTLASVTDPSVTGGFDEMVLNNIQFGGDKKYTYTFDATKDILKGIYADNQSTTPRDLTSYVPGAPATDMAIAWNIAPSVPFFSQGNPMVLSLTATAYDYEVTNKAKTLTIVGDNNGNKSFERSKIYRMEINFNESNLDATNDEICVDVTVTIANWVVVSVDPTFQTNPAE